MTDKPWSTTDIPDQSGRNIIITGASSGIGFEAARHLALRGAHVVLAVRNEAKGRAAAAAIAEEHPAAELEVRLVDLSDLESVRAFADRFRTDDGALDVLINNAGIMAPPRSLTRQGHESQFGTNHLGHFALTGLLLDRLAVGRDPRVITVCSLGHHGGRIHFEDLSGERAYSRMVFYRQSKFANAVFGVELDRRLRAARSPVRSLLVHPGIASTGLADHLTNAFVRLITKPVEPLIAQSGEDGAMPTLYAATHPHVEGGQYFGPTGRGERKGPPGPAELNPKAKDPETAVRLWSLSEELTEVHYGLPATA